MKNGIIRVGLIGAGANTRLRHIGGLRKQDGVEIVAVANRSRESGERIASEFEIPKVYDSWVDLIDADDIDAVCIGTWPYMHRTLTLAALENDKHVLTEARMAMDAQQAHEMLDASRLKPNLVTQVVPAPHALEVDTTVQETIASGYLGQPLAIRLRVADSHGRANAADTFMDSDAPLHWRQNRELSGYNIMGMGIWYEVISRYLGPATKVMAMTNVFASQRKDVSGNIQAVSIPDHVNVLCEMACGAQADFSWTAISGLQTGGELWMFGSDATLQLQGPPYKSVFGGRRGDQALSEIPIAPGKTGGWRVEEEFVKAIRGEGEITHTPFDQGVRYMEFTEAVTRSAQTGNAVYLPL